MDVPNTPELKPPRPLDPFRRAIVRGLGVLLPPLLTIVIILWVWNTVANYLLVPAENLARRGLVYSHDKNIVPADEVPPNKIVEGGALIDDHPYRQTGDGQFIPAEHYDEAEGPRRSRAAARDRRGSLPPLRRAQVPAAADRHAGVPVRCFCWCSTCSASSWPRASAGSSGCSSNASSPGCRWCETCIRRSSR